MSPTGAVQIALAIAFLTLGHVARARRWALLLNRYATARTRHLAGSLAVGYAANLALPFRLGELARAALISRRGGVDGGLAIATIVVERVLDALTVGAAIGLAAPLLGAADSRSGGLVTGLAGLAAGTIVLLALSTRAGGRTVACVAGLFNRRIQVFLLHVAWSARQVMRSLVKDRPAAYAVWTMAMWGAYVSSVALLGAGLNVPLSALLRALYLDWWRPSALAVAEADLERGDVAVVLVYAVLPLALILAATRIGLGWALGRLPRSLLGLAAGERQRAVRAFATPTDYGTFLEGVLSGTQPRFGLVAAGVDEGDVVERDMSGGSDAVTLLVRDRTGLRVRKLAVGEAAERLREQTAWLVRHNDRLPCAQVIGQRDLGDRYGYDMQYDATAVEFFGFLHSRPLEESSDLLRRLLADLRDGLHRPSTDAGELTAARATAYLEQKVLGTARLLEREVPEFWRPEHLVVNGEPMLNLAATGLLDLDRLRAWLPKGPAVDVHGDLTVDNVLIDVSSGTASWRLIDPNPRQLFPSPALDHGKLMQSLHGGYELLGRTPPPVMSGERIDFQVHLTAQYLELGEVLRRWILDAHGPAGLQEAVLHELVHFLRLLPYKLRNQRSHFPSYYATTVRLANELLVSA